MIPAVEAINAINRLRKDEVVVSIMTPNRYWEQVSQRPELDLPVIGGMGKASSVGLGLALARPDRKVWVLDGDGSLLMNLGTLVTIAAQRPANLLHFVFEDGVYQTTGGQPVPGAGVFDFAGIARSAGYEESLEFDDLEEFVSELPRILEAQGPVFVDLKVFHPGAEPAWHVRTTRDAVRQVMQALKND